MFEMQVVKRTQRIAGIVLGAAVTLVISGSSVEVGSQGPREVRDRDEPFLQRRIVVKGSGQAPTDRSLSAGQKELLALRAAKVIALRELAEVIGGVRVQGETSVRDVAAQTDTVRAAIDGLVRGARVIHESYDPAKEQGTVFLEVPFDGPYGLGSILPRLDRTTEKSLPQFRPQPREPPPAQAFDSVVVDVRGTPFKPGLKGRIVVEEGAAPEVVFDHTRVSQEVLSQRGIVLFAGDIEGARAALGKRGAGHPMVVKAVAAREETDVVIRRADADAIVAADRATGLLERANVVFLGSAEP